MYDYGHAHGLKLGDTRMWIGRKPIVYSSLQKRTLKKFMHGVVLPDWRVRLVSTSPLTMIL